jgi:hypothetical protein
MDLLETLTRVEDLYGCVLRLAEEQERRLVAGELAGLQTLLLDKDRAVAEAQGLLLRLKDEGGALRAPVAQESVGRVGALLGRVVETEERCRALAPAQTNTPPRAHAVAAYGRSSR